MGSLCPVATPMRECRPKSRSYLISQRRARNKSISRVVVSCNLEILSTPLSLALKYTLMTVTALREEHLLLECVG